MSFRTPILAIPTRLERYLLTKWDAVLVVAYLGMVAFWIWLCVFLFKNMQPSPTPLLPIEPIAIWREDLQAWQCVGGDKECEIHWCGTFNDCRGYQARLTYEEFGFWPADGHEEN